MNSDRQVVLVSGGSRGLGRALVADLLRHDYVVATFSRSRSSFIEELQAQDPDGASFVWEAIDGTDYERVRQFAYHVARRYGRLDVLVNNAGIGVDGMLTLMRPAEIRQGIALNLEAAIYLTQTCAKVMLQQERGCIINVSSVNGLRGHTGVSVYSATKAALDGMTRSLARELGRKGIRINSVAPGYFASDMADALTSAQQERIVRRTPLGRLGTVDDLVGAIRFLISPEAGFITGQTLVVDGGLSC